MKLVATSDWHGGLPRPEELPEGDVLAIVGDTTPVWDHDRRFQGHWIKNVLAPYLAELPFHVLLVGGNHDFVMQQAPIQKWMPANTTYLMDSSIEIDGVKFHGSPWSNQFGGWAFMSNENGLADRWAKIPEDTDVLLVHGPPFGACDKTTWGEENAGSRTLRESIISIKPKLVCCGHIHEAYGRDMIGQTIVANVSYVDLEYMPGNEPQVFELQGGENENHIQQGT